MILNEIRSDHVCCDVFLEQDKSFVVDFNCLYRLLLKP